MKIIEQVRGDVSLPMVLEGQQGFYNHGTQNDMLIMAFVAGADNPQRTILGYNVQMLNSQGSHVAVIPEAVLPQSPEDSFILFVTSPGGSFAGHVFSVKFKADVNQLVATNLQALNTLASTLGAFITAAMAKLDTVMLMTEANVEVEYDWDEDGTNLLGSTTKLLVNDAAPNFNSPDKVMVTTYTRDDLTGRLLKKTVKEVTT